MADRLQMCPVAATVDVMGGKWKPIILFHLLHGTHRFGELKRIVPGVTQKMLTQQLRELETDGMISRRVYAQTPPKVEYSLTPLGESFKPVLLSMCDWGSGYQRRLRGEDPEPPPVGARTPPDAAER